MRCAEIIGVLASATLLAACFPDFQFGSAGGDETGGNPTSSRAASGSGGFPSNGGAPSNGGFGHGGDGGDGGIGGGAGPGPTTSTATSTSTSSGVIMPSVPCGDGNSTIVECSPSQACCFSLTSASLDHCGASGSCEDYTFTCNEQSDCASGVCCAESDFFGFTGVIACVASCSGDRLCADTRDCNAGETCEQFFSSSFAPEYAPAYRICI